MPPDLRPAVRAPAHSLPASASTRLSRPGVRLRLPLLVAALSLTACGPLIFETEVDSETLIEGNSSGLGGLLGQFPAFAQFSSIDFNANQDLVNQGVTKEEIDSVKVIGVALTIRSPSSQDFDFLDSLSFQARAGNLVKGVGSRSGIAELGLQAPNPTLQLDVSGEELVDIVTAPEMTIEVSGSGRQPREDTLLEAVVRLRVEATPL